MEYSKKNILFLLNLLIFVTLFQNKLNLYLYTQIHQILDILTMIIYYINHIFLNFKISFLNSVIFN